MNATAIAESACHPFTNVGRVPCPLFRPKTGCALVPFLERVRVPSTQGDAQHCMSPNFRECSAFRTATNWLAPIGGIDCWCRVSTDRPAPAQRPAA